MLAHRPSQVPKRYTLSTETLLTAKRGYRCVWHYRQLIVSFSNFEPSGEHLLLLIYCMNTLLDFFKLPLKNV